MLLILRHNNIALFHCTPYWAQW